MEKLTVTYFFVMVMFICVGGMLHLFGIELGVVLLGIAVGMMLVGLFVAMCIGLVNLWRK